MATPTPSNISDNSLKRSHCSSKENGGDHNIEPEKPNEQEESSIQKIHNNSEVVKGDRTKRSSTSSEEAAILRIVPVPPVDITSTVVRKGSDEEDESGRERLKRHRMEMGGRVWIPDTWGQENSLKNWIDCTAFDASLVNNSILSARAALIQQRSTTSSTHNLTLHRRIENKC